MILPFFLYPFLYLALPLRLGFCASGDRNSGSPRVGIGAAGNGTIHGTHHQVDGDFPTPDTGSADIHALGSVGNSQGNI